MSEQRKVLINADGLVKIYKSGDVEVMALQGLDMQIYEGELIAVIGKSGSGKSTLMNIVGGLERPTAGKLFFDGEDLYRKSDDKMVDYRKNKVGFVWQQSSKNLLPYLTVLENVMLPTEGGKLKKKERKKRALSLLEEVGILHKADRYPGQLSGGEQQRAAIAVALANEPDVLLADEPTGAVDQKTSLKIQELFRKLRDTLGITVIIVTHDLKLAHNVDRVLMISDGKISTEKVRREQVKKDMENAFASADTHEEYSVLDKAGRLQLNEEMLEAAGISGNRVRVEVKDGRICISA